MKTTNENEVIERSDINNNDKELKEKVFLNFLIKHFIENRNDLSKKEIEKLKELKTKYGDEFTDIYNKINLEINKQKSNK